AKAQFRSLAEPWADTGTSTGRLMIAVLGGLLDVERDLIRTRTAEGRSRAQKRGQHMGPTAEIDGGATGPKHRRRAQGAKAIAAARPCQQVDPRAPPCFHFGAAASISQRLRRAFQKYTSCDFDRAARTRKKH